MVLSEIFLFTRVDSSLLQLTGYMPDADSDGVADYRDECPDTDSDEDSNSAGCAPSQRDSDFDGIKKTTTSAEQHAIGTTIPAADVDVHVRKVTEGKKDKKDKNDQKDKTRKRRKDRVDDRDGQHSSKRSRKHYRSILTSLERTQ